MSHNVPAILKRSLSDRLLAITPAALLSLLLITTVAEYDTAGRLVYLRYLLFAISGLLAFILPYLSFPDPLTRLYQLGNYPPGHLLKTYIRRHQMIWGTATILILITALADPGLDGGELPARFGLVLYGVLFLTGIYLFAAARYYRIGRDSQEWNEGRRGAEVRKRLAEFAKYPIDPGSIPSLVATVQISGVGMMTVVIGALVHSVAGLAGEVLIALLLLVLGLTRLSPVRSRSDRFFYQANAFFSEFFTASSTPELEREPLQIGQLWWIPDRWKSHSWALMLQMDRKLPAGRFIVTGHLFLWVVAYQDAGSGVMLSAWAVFAVMHHGLMVLTANRAIAPRWWLRTLDRPVHWVLSRFFIQVRWLLPLMASMLVMNWLFGFFTGVEIGGIGLIYLLSGLLIATIISFRYERYWNRV